MDAVMLDEVLAYGMWCLLAVVGLSMFFVGWRLWRGSADAYEMNRAVSKSFKSSLFGDLRQSDTDQRAVFNRGIVYSLEKSGNVKFHPQAKISREAIRDTSV